MIRRCCSTSRRRTSGIAETGLTAVVTAGFRISPATSSPSSSTRGWSGSVPTSMRRRATTSYTASGSPGSAPARNTPSAAARYIAPVPKYRAPNDAASRRATVDFPVPAGPSTATTPRNPSPCCTRLTSRLADGSIVPATAGELPADRAVEGTHLGTGQHPDRPGALLPEADVGDRGAHQALHRVPDLSEQPAHHVLAPLVQHHLDQRLARQRLHNPEAVHCHGAVVELHPGPQRPAH